MLIDSLLYTNVFIIYFLLIAAADLRPAIIGGAGVPHVCAVDVAEVAGVAVAIVDGDLPSGVAAAVLLGFVTPTECRTQNELQHAGKKKQGC